MRTFKAKGNLQPADFLASRIVSAYSASGFPLPDFITCVPVTKREFAARGYSPARLLAKAVSKKLGVPFEQNALSKIYDTIPQRSLPKALRNGNIFGVFEADTDMVFARTVLLIDDVMTTGSTVNECAKMMKLAGAYKVFCAVAAKAVFSGGEEQKND